ncbi:MAG: hypothetical protein KZQ90_00260 [Candidatus Thiodiazotropha sp. (ex Codakia rugifera)]|nr:hypothetical protein [Candidatus Thiodiazotropha sp. (ex Codakia rugifera)]
MKCKILLLVFAVIALIVVPAAASGGEKVKPNKKAKPVEIVNPVPLPVTGEVMVNNTEENPVPVLFVDEERRTPYQGSMRYHRVYGHSETIIPLDPPLDFGMILTIEYISGSCDLAFGVHSFQPRIITNFQEIEYIHNLVPVFVNTVLSDSTESLKYIIAQKTLIFADTDHPIEPRVPFTFSHGNEPVVSCQMVVSGFLNNSQ